MAKTKIHISETDMVDIIVKVDSLLKKEGLDNPHYGDVSGVDYLLINRQEYEAHHYSPVKYFHNAKNLDEEYAILEDHARNLNIATERVLTVIKQIRNRLLKKGDDGA